MAETSGKFSREIAVLNEQKAALQEKIKDLNAKIQQTTRELVTAREEQDVKLREQKDACDIILRCELEGIKKLVENIRAEEPAKSTWSSNMSEEIQSLKSQLHDAQSLSSEVKAQADSQIAELKSKTALLEGENAKLIERAKTIGSRYGKGDLVRTVMRRELLLTAIKDSQERAFVNDLVKTTQGVHEQELIATSNDVRRVSNPLNL